MPGAVGLVPRPEMPGIESGIVLKNAIEPLIFTDLRCCNQTGERDAVHPVSEWEVLSDLFDTRLFVFISGCLGCGI